MSPPLYTKTTDHSTCLHAADICDSEKVTSECLDQTHCFGKKIHILNPSKTWSTSQPQLINHLERNMAEWHYLQEKPWGLSSLKERKKNTTQTSKLELQLIPNKPEYTACWILVQLLRITWGETFRENRLPTTQIEIKYKFKPFTCKNPLDQVTLENMSPSLKQKLPAQLFLYTCYIAAKKKKNPEMSGSSSLLFRPTSKAFRPNMMRLR